MFDIVINNGLIIDPETQTRCISNVGILNGTIAVITNEKIQGAQEFDVTNRIVCLSFIDVHGHVDLNDY